MKKLYDEGQDPTSLPQNAEALSQQCRSEVPTGGYTADHIGMGIISIIQKSMQCIMPFHQLRVK